MQFTSFPIGQYASGQTFLHRLDPRSKIMFVLVYVIMLFGANTSLLLAVYAGIAYLAVRLSNFSLLYFWQGLKWTFLLIVFFGLFQLISVQTGHQLCSCGWIEIYDDGVKHAVFLTCRFVLLIQMASLLTLTTPPALLTLGWQTLLRPLNGFGFPSEQFALMMTVAVRYIPAFLQEIDYVTKALTARGADFESGNLIKRCKTMLRVLARLFIFSFRRSHELAVAMESRCYREGWARTNRQTLHPGWRDAIVGFSALCLFIITLLFRDWD